MAGTATDYSGTVRVIRTAPATFRNLARTEGSLVTNDSAVQNEPLWTSLSVGTYASNIRNGRTGARRLDLPLVAQGARPIDLVRRPAAESNEDRRPRSSSSSASSARRRFASCCPMRLPTITSLPTVTPATPIARRNLAVNSPVVRPA